MKKKKGSFEGFCSVAESLAVVIGFVAVVLEGVGKIPEAKENFEKLTKKPKKNNETLMIEETK